MRRPAQPGPCVRPWLLGERGDGGPRRQLDQADLVEPHSQSFHQDLAPFLERNGHVRNESPRSLEDQRPREVGVSAREDRFERDVEGRSITSINVDLDMLLLAVEQSWLLVRGVCEPYSLHDPRAVGFRQYRVAVLGPDPGIGAVEAVVVAAGTIIRAEADRLDAWISQPGQQSQVVQLSRRAGGTKACRGGRSRRLRNKCPGLRQQG